MRFYTQRLYIRPIKIEDKEAVFNYRSDSETNRFLSLIPNSVDDIANFISKTSKEFNIPGTWFQFVIFEQKSNSLIGDIGIHFLENNQIEIGYTLDKKIRRRGYASEALTTLINYFVGTLQKHRITASIDPRNLDSIKLVVRLGFRKEAHFVKSLFFRDEWVDDVIYALLAKEWKKM